MESRNKRLLILSVFGTRPQYMKVTAIDRAIKKSGAFDHVIVNTGQHYDPNMSSDFERELGISPDFDLCSAIEHDKWTDQFGHIMTGLGVILSMKLPAVVLVYGDTNSTLAAALCAKRAGFTVGHIEAGYRCGNMETPEEQNRVMVDSISDYLYCPTPTCHDNLRDAVLRTTLTGDIAYDIWKQESKSDEVKNFSPSEYLVSKNGYYLATIHRAENTDDPERLEEIFRFLNAFIGQFGHRIIFPIHPSTKKKIKFQIPDMIGLINPVPYRKMIALELNTKVILTDSGTLQKEAFFANKHCVVLRGETEYSELIASGHVTMATNNLKKVQAYKIAMLTKILNNDRPIFGDGKAAEHIVNLLKERLLPNDRVPETNFKLADLPY